MTCISFQFIRNLSTDDDAVDGLKNTEDRVDQSMNDTLVLKTLELLEEGRTKMSYHPKKEYVLIVGKAGTGEYGTWTLSVLN